jgi:hypothetical protein
MGEVDNTNKAGGGGGTVTEDTIPIMMVNNNKSSTSLSNISTARLYLKLELKVGSSTSGVGTTGQGGEVQVKVMRLCG